MPNWQSTRLATEIFSRSDIVNEVTLLNVTMPAIEAVLKSNAPASLDFTLHDNEHSFRVAEMSAGLFPDSLGDLSTFELSLLLMASYCHDIGMSPQRQKIKDHYNWLMTGDTSVLTKLDKESFQNWLDTNRAGLTAPVDSSQITITGLSKVDDAVAYYSRSRHNDWSEDFIRSELTTSGLSLYPGWIEDLVTLCKSHHEGLSELRSSRFNAKNVGSPARPVNLRFLAAILRLADVLEFAPERTPEVVLKSRSIAAASRIYWYKDHSISFEIDYENHHLIFSAQTPNALIHKAVLTTADWVNAELALCATLSQENAFTSGVVASSRRAIYVWPWPSRLVADIRELTGAFVYIDGSFRPDTQKVLALLSGTALYQTPIVAVRELIQNSLDAVREQIAYSRLAMDNPLAADSLKYLNNLHQVTVTFTANDGKYLLICEDNGSGMTRSIIEGHVLVSGSGIRGESRRLERSARDAGFAVERTGRFGIGVLSYFMLSDALTITTRRSQEAGDHDSSAWKFVINGLDGFGELSRDTRTGKGTTVSLELKDSIVGATPSLFFDRLAAYVSENFRWLPCKLIIRNDVGSTPQISMGPGWAHSVEFDERKLISSLFRNDEPDKKGFASEEETRLRFEKSQKVKSMMAIAESSLRWTQTAEVPLQRGEGFLRGSIPYFLVEGDSSALFTGAEKLDADFAWGSDAFRRPKLTNYSSLHGIMVSSAASNISDCHLDVDIRKNTDIMVDRSRLIDPVDSELIGQVRRLRYSMWKSFLDSNSSSRFNEINVIFAPISAADRSSKLRPVPFWLLRDDKNSPALLKRCDSSVSSIGRFSFYDWTDYHVCSPDAETEAVPIGAGSGERVFRLHHLYGGGKLIIQPVARNAMFGVTWNSPDDFVIIDNTVMSLSARFPNSWKDVVAVNVQGRVIFNLEHSLIQRLAHVEFNGVVDIEPSDIDKAIEAAAGSTAHAESFVIHSLSWATRYWKWVQENRQSEVNAIFDLFTAEDKPLFVANAAKYTANNRLIDLRSALNSSSDISVAYPDVPAEHMILTTELGKDKRK